MSLPAPAARAAPLLAGDLRALAALRYQAQAQPDAQTTRAAARQFEALFMHELIRSMRAATRAAGLQDADGDPPGLGQELLDEQLALTMSGLPGGLAEAVQRQIARQTGLQPAGPGANAGTGASAQATLPPPSTLSLQRPGAGSNSTAAAAPELPASARRAQFIRRLAPIAERVARASGIPAQFMLGQAGHETGWGRSEIRCADGSNSFNLFAIKAGKGWGGKVAQAASSEYLAGQPQRVPARFRAYGSYDEAFADYARLIGASPRYAAARAQLASAPAFADALQQAGYATDPGYARKLGAAIALAAAVGAGTAPAQRAPT